MNCPTSPVVRWIVFFLLPLSFLDAQPVKLKVPSPDSILGRYIDRGFVEGMMYVEGTTIGLPGTVVTLSDQPVDTPADADTWLMRTTTGKDGVYRFELVPRGRYYLEAECPGYFPSSQSVWIERQELIRVNVRLVPDYSHPSVHKTGSVEILTTDKSTGEPIEGARIYFREDKSYVETDELGASHVHHLWPGRYHLYITADGYRDRIEDSVDVKAGRGVPYEAELRELVLSRGDLLCHERHHLPYPITTLHPADYCTLTGTIVDLDAMEYVPFVQVYLAPFGLVAETDSSGTFTFHGVRPGVYCATIRVQGFERTTLHEIDLAAGASKTVRLIISRRNESAGE